MPEIERRRARSREEEFERWAGSSRLAVRSGLKGKNRVQVYGWLKRVLIQQECSQQGKAARGLIRGYVAKMTPA